MESPYLLIAVLCMLFTISGISRDKNQGIYLAPQQVGNIIGARNGRQMALQALIRAVSEFSLFRFEYRGNCPVSPSVQASRSLFTINKHGHPCCNAPGRSAHSLPVA